MSWAITTQLHYKITDFGSQTFSPAEYCPRGDLAEVRPDGYKGLRPPNVARQCGGVCANCVDLYCLRIAQQRLCVFYMLVPLPWRRTSLRSFAVVASRRVQSTYATVHTVSARTRPYCACESGSRAHCSSPASALAHIAPGFAMRERLFTISCTLVSPTSTALCLQIAD